MASIDELSRKIGEIEANIEHIQKDINQIRILISKRTIPISTVYILCALFGGIFAWLAVLTKIIIIH